MCNTEQPETAAVRLAVEVAERRLKELDNKRTLTRAESYERLMTVDCIKRGRKLLFMGGKDE